MVSNEMQEYLEEYFKEAEEHIDNLNTAILDLEKDAEDEQAIQQMFRSFHTLKSSSKAMELNDIGEFAHKSEDVLGRLRDKEIKATENIIDLLFSCVDTITSMITKVKEGSEEKVDVSHELANLAKVLEVEAGKEGDLVFEIEKKLQDSVERVSTVKVDIKKLDSLVESVGELLIAKLSLENVSHKSPEVEQIALRFDRLIQQLQYEVMKIRMVPVGHVLNKFPRMVRDLAQKVSKEINFSVSGAEIELDRTVLDEIGKPLVHLLRNAVDHAFESPEERLKAGKKETGMLEIVAKREKNAVIIVVKDDGRGFDPELIKSIAIKRNFVSQEELDTMNEKEILRLPFRPEFSTKQEVSEISGRGVGLDVVQTKIAELGGNVELKTEVGKGSTFILELPLTLAIVSCFLVKAELEVYALPMSNIVRSIRITPEEIKTMEKQEVLIFDENQIPLLRLARVLHLQEKAAFENEEESADESQNAKNYFAQVQDDALQEDHEREIAEELASGLELPREEEIKEGEKILEKREAHHIAVVVEKSGERAALLVDSIIGKQDVIIKPLDKSLKQASGFSGATILGNGKTALVLDIASLLK